MLKKGRRKCKYEREFAYKKNTHGIHRITKKIMFGMWQLLAECEQQISNIFLIEVTVVYDL